MSFISTADLGLGDGEAAVVEDLVPLLGVVDDHPNDPKVPRLDGENPGC